MAYIERFGGLERPMALSGANRMNGRRCLRHPKRVAPIFLWALAACFVAASVASGGTGDPVVPSLSAGYPGEIAQALPPSPVPQSLLPAPSKVTPAAEEDLVQMQFDNIELRDLIRFVSNIMAKNFIYDDAVVKGRVTVLSPTSLAKDEVFRVFESVLNYYGFGIVATPEAYKIVRSADAKGMAVETLDKSKFMEQSP
jgi:hypothetical protein